MPAAQPQAWAKGGGTRGGVTSPLYPPFLPFAFLLQRQKKGSLEVGGGGRELAPLITPCMGAVAGNNREVDTPLTLAGCKGGVSGW